MVVSKSHTYFTPEEYLELECMGSIKHEYLQGQMVAMAGASKAHAIITDNLSALLVSHLRSTDCIAYTTDMKVRLPLLNLFYYPDLAVTCDDRDRISNQNFFCIKNSLLKCCLTPQKRLIEEINLPTISQF